MMFKPILQNVIKQKGWLVVEEPLKTPRGATAFPRKLSGEYAARGGTTTAYSFGDNHSDLENYAWYPANSNWQTHPVKTRMANPYGLHDMHGNVWEWVQDYWTKDLPGECDPLITSGLINIFRGGAWNSKVWALRSDHRYGIGLSYGRAYVGFRLVRNL